MTYSNPVINLDIDKLNQDAKLLFKFHRDTPPEQPLDDLAHDVAFYITEDLEYSLPQFIYYTEQILFKTQTNGLDKFLSDHIIEDTNTIDEIGKEALTYTLVEYLKSEYQDEYSPNRVEPTTDVLEVRGSQDYYDDFDNILRQCVQLPADEVTTFNDWDDLQTVKETAHERYKTISKNWSWTQRSLFIDYLRKHARPGENEVDVHIPSEQYSARDGDSLREILGMIEYWTLDCYIDAITETE